MPVTATHPDYDKRIKQWERCRHAVAGEDAIKQAGTVYLPRLSGHTDNEYDAYKKRAVWYNATSRTVDGLTGLIFRKPPSIDSPDTLAGLLEDVTTDGLSIQEFSELVTEEAIVVGRGGILVDYPHVEVSDEETQAEIEQRGDRPYLAHYAAEAITNWHTGRIGNRTVLTMVVLKEQFEEREDEFESKVKDQYRVLRLNEAGQYIQQIWRKFRTEEDREERWRLVGEAAPMMRGAALDYIPFYFFGPRDASPSATKPPILDLASMNVAHYRTMADLENGRHWTGLPTPIFTGRFVTEGGEEVTEVKLGSTEGIHLESDGDAKFLEFTGKGLEALENGAKAKEEYMAVLGARILAQEKRMVEAAETAQIHRSGENSVLASVANAVSKVLTRALETLVEWSGATAEVTLELNTDFSPTEMSPQMLQAILGAWQQGAMAFEDLVEQLKKGELIRSERTAEDIRQDHTDEAPAAGGSFSGGVQGGLFG